MASKAQKRAAKAAARASKTLATKKAEETKVTTEVKPAPEVATKAEEKKPTPAPAQTPAKEQKPAVKEAEKPAETKPAPTPEKPKQETKKEEVKTPKTSQSKQPEKPAEKQKKEDKKPAQKTGPEIPEIPVEEVKKKPDTSLASSVIRNEKDGRIDANHSIDLMTSLERRYLTPGADVPEELKKAVSSQFDAMMWVNLVRWNEQTKEDFDAANLLVNEEIFAKMQQGLAEVFGITLKALPHVEGEDPHQLKIDFDATNATAPKETQEAIKEAVKAPVLKELKELPKYDPTMDEAACVKALRDIAETFGKFTVQEKLQALIDFTRRAWKLQNETVTKVLSVMLSKIQNPKCFTFNCWSSIAYGGVTSYAAPFVTHCTVRDKIKDYGYNEEQIAEIVRFFITLRATNNSNGNEEELSKRLSEITGLMGVFDKKLITKAIEAYSKKKDFDLPKVKGWVYDKTKEFNIQKVVETIKLSYGNLKQKELIDKLTELAELYKKEFKPIEQPSSK